MNEAIQPISQSMRETKLKDFAARYRKAVPLVKGNVRAVLLQETVVAGWSWVLLRASLDIGEKILPAEGLITTSLATTENIVALIERPGARLALPAGYDAAQWSPAPTVKLWSSHLTGEPLPNPWATGDLLDQAFVRNQLGEDFARELEIAAEGGRSYRAEFERRANEHLATAAKDFDPATFNPWIEAFDPADKSPEALSWHMERAAEIRRLEQHNRPLNEWLKKIATPQFMNPWEAGPSRDMIKEMLVLKGDGLFGRHLKRTAAWKSSQLDYELREAENAAAEAKRRAEDARYAAAQRAR